ncbi:MAG TPA: hypothetical protein VNC78_09635 [Actinomycetota bacterium]|nr:hypothetical protein [Actinomycetota bacterium]
MALCILGGPLAGLAGANPIEWIKENGVPKNGCEVQDMLGVVNVRECESYPNH